MIEILLISIIALVLAAVVMLAFLIRRSSVVDFSPVLTRLETLEKLQEHAERSITDVVGQGRQASEQQASTLRTEIQGTLKTAIETLVQSVDRISATQQQRLDAFAKELSTLKQTNENSAVLLRNELSEALRDFRDSLQRQMNEMAALQKQQLDVFAAQIGNLAEKNEKKFDELRATVEAKLSQLQADNSAKLESMRLTVDEKLQSTLEKRLGESFKLVGDRLEQVQKGLGEMQVLAAGVGDLKKVLTNVKTRGTWGEVQLGAMLEQILSPDQYESNVSTKGGNERVEFAIKLPGRSEDRQEVVWLPIDAKFPVEDYQRLMEAQEMANIEAAEQASRQLDVRIKQCAHDISEKYISPPKTTDFGILFLPTEGLFAEVIRRPGLSESIQREFRVIIAGPTTLWSILNSLQMGFRTLAIQKRSSEVWKVLGAVKAEFGKFGDILDRVKKKLDETSNTIDAASTRSRQLERKLRTVEALPATEASSLLADVQSADLDAENRDQNNDNE